MNSDLYDDERQEGGPGENSEFAKLFRQSMAECEPGSRVLARVVEVRDDGVVVDVGYKSEAVLRTSEFSAEEIAELTPGAEFEVVVVSVRDGDGTLIVSKRRAERANGWQAVREAHESGTMVTGRIIERVKGGLIVDINGFHGFLPASQADLKVVRNLDSLVGVSGAMKVLKVNERRMNAVLSRRAAMEEERFALREKTVAELAEGAVVKGTVKNITDYGAFIDLGGIDGLLHVSDLSWGRVGHPSDVLTVGQEVEVKVLKFDREAGKISLGYRQCLPDPWETVPERYRPGAKVEGTVVSVVDYGAFVELEPGVEGLVHLSELSWVEKIRQPSKVLERGQKIHVVVLDVNREKRRISLSLRQAEPNPWILVAERYTAGQKVRGVVKNITDFGVFVRMKEGIDGLVHVSDLSWTRHVRHPSELISVGEEVDVVVLNVDVARERLSLGRKQLEPDPWEEGIRTRYHAGDEVDGTVVKVVDFGIFVELEGGVEGLVFMSEIDPEDQDALADRCVPGTRVRVRVLKVDVQERKIGLSLKGGMLRR